MKIQSHIIQSTTNYSLFVNNPHQRSFKPRKVKALMAKMKANGFPPSMAISVYRSTGALLVINSGHHRLAAARELGIPVLYVIEHKWSHRELSDEGEISTAWSVLDHIANFAKEGNDAYGELLRLQEIGLHPSLAASMLIGESAGSGNALYDIKTGGFKIKDLRQVNAWIAMREEFCDKVTAITHRSFITAWSKCMFTPAFDQDVFIKRLRANPKMLDKCSTEDQSLQQIEDLYNFKTPNKIPLAFLVKENSKDRHFNRGTPKAAKQTS